MVKLKPILFLCILLLSQTQAKAQQIPNAHFDSVYFGGIDRIFQWITSDGFAINAGSLGDTILPLEPNSSYFGPGFQFSELLFTVNSAYQDPFLNNSLQLTQNNSRVRKDSLPFPAFIINGEHLATDHMGYPDFFRSGNPFTFRPDSLTGYYKFTDSLSAVDNWGRVLLFLTKYDSLTQTTDTIAHLNSVLDLSPVDEWTRFSLAIPYLSSEIPDSMALTIFASVTPELFGVLGIDELTFVYDTATTYAGREALNDWQIFPNPVSSVLYISPPEQGSYLYVVYDMYGREMIKGENLQQIDISSWGSGAYFLRVSQKGKSFMTQFWIQN
ncbi:MAG: T9SS type A sorting domain-containing protein [Bacteroidota bacterium]